MKTRPVSALLMLILAVSPSAAFAEPSPPDAKSGAMSGPVNYAPPALPEAPAPGAMLLRLGLATGFVLVLCVTAMLLAYRRAKALEGKTGGGKLQLVESLSLGGGSSLHLIRSAGQRFVVAVNRSGLQSLVPLSESFEETFDSLRADPLETPRRPAARSRVA